MTRLVASGAWICHTGKVRKVNEDACLFGGIFSGASTSAPMKAAIDEERWIVALADGIGGHRAGAFASREVVESLASHQEYTPANVKRIIRATHKKLQQIGDERPELQGTGSTVVGLFSGRDGLFAFNVGDARLYRQHAGRLKLITQDDSVEQLLMSEGLLKAHDGVRSSYMHALTQSIGGSADGHPVEPHFYPLSVARVGRFILCTDGLTDMLSTAEMEALAVPQLKAAQAVQSLFTATMEAGGRDNITIAVLDVEKV